MIRYFVGEKTLARHLVYLLALLAALTATPSAPAAALVTAGDNPLGPTTITDQPGNRDDGFTVVEEVSYDPLAGAWHKEFRNTGFNIASGVNVAIDETFTNGGLQTWTDWHEQILSTTTIGVDSSYPGFLFTGGSLNVFRNGGLLTEGTDYTLVVDSVFDQFSPGGDWSALSIFFNPSSAIQVGDTLRITKQIFEVFGDGNIWQTDEIALVGQYPTVPEPSSLVLAAVGLVGLIARGCRRRTHRVA